MWNQSDQGLLAKSRGVKVPGWRFIVADGVPHSGADRKNVIKSYGHLFNGPPPLATFLPLDAFSFIAGKWAINDNNI